MEEKNNKVIEYYSNYDEQGRLEDSWGEIEFVRSVDILNRYLPNPPVTILDVGGAAGRYSYWLAEKGYQVHLIDPVPLHIQQARENPISQTAKLASLSVGDARRLEFENESVDAVLLMGPLYHLTEQSDRIKALKEALRVLKPGGIVFAVGISRFASTIDGLQSDFYLDPAFKTIMRTDLDTGQHRNPTGNPKYFMDTFFHHPNELRTEVAEAGFQVKNLLAIESICYMMKDFETQWKEPDKRQFLLEIISRIEAEPTLLGASPHIMCVGTKE